MTMSAPTNFIATRRERFMNEQSYRAFVASTTHAVNECSSLLETELPTADDPDRAFTQWTGELFTEEMQLLVGSYSAGVSLHETAARFPKLISLGESHLLPHPKYRTEPFYLDELDTYAYAMWLLSLCKLLRLDPLLPRVVGLFNVAREDNRGKDALFEALVGKLGQPAVSAKSMLKNLKAHPLLLQAIEAAPEKRSLYVTEFLKKWYPAMKGTYWHGRHERAPQNFFGYWAFEAGLVTYLWDIDDKPYRDLPFYPKDLVDYARANPEINFAALGESHDSTQALRALAGEPCPREGWWVAVVKADSRRHFKAGELMPDLKSESGITIWQWDSKQ
jgi:Domain of unknown function (DUF1911)/Domain of unknown function (DUF1910)